VASRSALNCFWVGFGLSAFFVFGLCREANV
jgi:hypothetical protein